MDLRVTLENEKFTVANLSSCSSNLVLLDMRHLKLYLCLFHSDNGENKSYQPYVGLNVLVGELWLPKLGFFILLNFVSLCKIKRLS